MLATLAENGYEDKLTRMLAFSFENFRDRASRDSAVWLYKTYRDAAWYKKAAMSDEKELITLIYILDATFREISNQHETSENKRTNKQVFTILFKEGLVTTYFEKADVDNIIRINTLLEDVKDLDPEIKLNLRNYILDRHPEFKFRGADIREQAPRGLIVTQEKYDEKKKQLSHILEVEVPANSKEIAFALSLGDLRENAEYKAGKERQEILNTTIAKLKDEIDRAQLFDTRSVNTTRVSFGTQIKLRNNGTGTSEIFTILGPWESDPDNKIISYLSPFGNAVMNRKPDETFEFKLNDEKVSYTVVEITAAKL
jgi:transcription elongation factor GreA